MSAQGADNAIKRAIAEALATEYRLYRAARRSGDVAAGWHHLERAHILAQTNLRAHIASHGAMLAFAIRQGDGREAAGQLVRLMLAPLGNFTGRLPFGNTGRSNVSAFAPMALPPDLAAVLSRNTP